jgi:hypothetical protein
MFGRFQVLCLQIGTHQGESFTFTQMSKVRYTSRKPKKLKVAAVRVWRGKGEDIARPLIFFLNPRIDFPEAQVPIGPRNPVTSDRSNLHKLVRALKLIDLVAGRLNPGSLWHEEQHARRRCVRLAEFISELQSKYAWRDGVVTNERHLIAMSKPDSGFEMRRAWEGKDFYKFVKHPVASDSFSPIETEAFYALREVLNQGWLWRLKMCLGCGAWFWARKVDQECCSKSPRCVQLKWRSPEMKNRRKANAEYLRKRDEGKPAPRSRAAFA